ncbi:MAG: hypothetical protein PUD70_07785, partial [Firmicutes bacterium]|nr:hypothetical protein [Bacillota bacterium]
WFVNQRAPYVFLKKLRIFLSGESPQTMRARLVSNRYAIGYCSVSLHGTLNQQYCSLAALARERPWLPPGVVLRAASQNLNDCQWQSYHNSLAVERSETDEDRRNVSIVNAVHEKVLF